MHPLLFVEDDPRLAQSVAAALNRETSGTLLVTTVHTGAAAIQVARERRFDLALVDLGLPDESGIEVIGRLGSLTPPLPAFAFTIFDDREQVLASIRAGAAGYVLKEEPVSRLVELIHECLAGHTPISSRVARHLFELCRPPEGMALTFREREVLDCITRGLTYAETAQALGVAVSTIQTHIKALYRKLDVNTKAEAAAWAARHWS